MHASLSLVFLLGTYQTHYLQSAIGRDAATFTFLVVVCCFFHRWLLLVWKQTPWYLPVLFLNNHKQPPTTLIGIAGTTTNLQNRNSRKNWKISKTLKKIHNNNDQKYFRLKLRFSGILLYLPLATLPDVICFFSFQKKKSAVQLVWS